jgi:predicted Zn-ribbon and HTH transcriptional regulator
MKKLKVCDNQVITVWKCENECESECGKVEVDVTFFQDNGIPLCSDCDSEMIYDYTYLNRNYDGTNCPKCGSGKINGNQIESDGYDKFYRNSNCENCGSNWIEEAVILTYKN